MLFGTFRFLLAHMVMTGHLWREVGFGRGTYAVFGFYLLSGFLMTLVLQRTYGFSRAGFGRYVGNRALRIYPPYLVVAGLAVAVIVLVPEATRSVSYLRLPDTPELWLRNLFLFGLHFDKAYSSRLVPPAWSVEIELWFYLAMGLGLARSRRVGIVWFAASVVATLVMLATDAPFRMRYASLLGASLPYSMGSLLYWYREPLGRCLRSGWHAPLAFALFFLHAARPDLGFGTLLVGGFYTSLALAAYATASLSHVPRARVPGPLARLDALLGDLSYPIFLCHWPLAVVVTALGLADANGRSLFLWTLPAATLGAFAVNRLVEKPVAALRDRVRPGSRA